MKLDTSHWLEYRIGGLFELSKGTRLTKANMIEGDIRFVSAANVHNGVTAYIGNNERVHSEGTITVCYNGNGGTGKAFYQDKPYWASDDVHVLYPKFRLPETFEGVERTGLNATVGLSLHRPSSASVGRNMASPINGNLNTCEMTGSSFQPMRTGIRTGFTSNSSWRKCSDAPAALSKI